MKLSANITVNTDADLLFKSFKPELKDWKRSKIKIKKNKGKVQFTIDAEDAVAMRATLNSITALLAVYDKTNRLMKKNG
jgi:tRNA threonylcarbamoyladenosine modification (KEOPS) complex  Pcc1 subunit|tara:strand:- start:974 stop:1210 length:237 start_codon:yes stop_codon:yes gene_type:complete